MRLIDADSLKERMFAETPEHEKGVVDVFFEAVAVMIDEQPTIEQQEIIRCKDCRHRRRLECPIGITVFDAPKDDEFCSRAERREE